MKLQRKLAILADAAKYDASCASSGSVNRDAEKVLGQPARGTVDRRIDPKCTAAGQRHDQHRLFEKKTPAELYEATEGGLNWTDFSLVVMSRTVESGGKIRFDLTHVGNFADI